SNSGIDFFFQAEDGIRDFHVTGVQTCALPIYRGVEAIGSGVADAEALHRHQVRILDAGDGAFAAPQRYCLAHVGNDVDAIDQQRSEERRVGKELRTGVAPYEKKTILTKSV